MFFLIEFAVYFESPDDKYLYIRLHLILSSQAKLLI